MYKEQYDINDYLISGVKSDKPLQVVGYTMSGLQIRGFFTVLYRNIFETSTPKNAPLPETIVEEAEKNGKYEVLVKDQHGIDCSFQVKKLEKAKYPTSFGNFDFGERFK